MSQERVRQLLLELDGEATSGEIMNLAQNEYPDQSLHRYLTDRLQSMKKKGLVQKSGEKWKLTDIGQNTTFEHNIDELDAIINESDLSRIHGITIGNIVATLRLDTRLQLEYLFKNLQNTTYHPETYPSMVYKPSKELGLTVLVPSSGKLTIVGAKSKEELVSETEDFIKLIEGLGIDVDKDSSHLLIQNILATCDIEREIDLNSLLVGLGLENVEYEPEQFPGLIYRRSGTTTISIFRTGKISILGAKTYDEVAEAREDIISMMNSIGIEIEVD